MLNVAIALLNVRKNRILLVAQASLPQPQFLAFKKLFLDELGKRGFESDLSALINESEIGMEMGRKTLCKRGGAEMIEQLKKS